MLKKKYILILLSAFFIGIFIKAVSLHASQYPLKKQLVSSTGHAMGGDFIAFYSAGRIYKQSPDKLYNFEHQHETQQEVFRNAEVKPGVYPFIYPPLVATLFSSISKFDYLLSYWIWIGLSCAIYIFCVYKIINTTGLKGLEKFTAISFGAGFLPFTFNCIGPGQTSALGLLIASLVFVFLKKDKHLLAGIALGFAYYKPPLFLGLSILFLLKGNFRIIGGAFLSCVTLCLISIYTIGLDGFFEYLRLASGYTYGNDIVSANNLHTKLGVGLYAMIWSTLGQNILVAKPLYLVLFIGLIFLALKRTSENNSTWLIILGLGTSLFISPQMVTYDLTLMILPIIVLGKELLQKNSWMQATVYICSSVLIALLPMLPVYNSANGHFNTTALAFLLFLLLSFSTKPRNY